MLFLDWCDIEENKERGERLKREWTGFDEHGNPVKIESITHASTKKMLWEDEYGHTWAASLAHRTPKNFERDCPECAKKNRSISVQKAKTKYENSLSTWCLNNPEMGQIIKNQWTGICEDGKHYTIDEVSYGSGLKMLWRCDDGHKWYATIANRTYKNFRGNCPYCTGKKVSDLNSLHTYCLNNPETGQIITNQWTGISDDGKHYTMDEVAYGSHLKMLWECDECHHQWYASINNRTRGRGCPHCNKRGTSYPEQYIYWALKQIYPETQNRCKVLQSPKYPQGIEYDIIVPDIPLAIEYSPTFWHKGKEERDNLKKEICNKCNIRLIQIIEDSYNEYEEIFTDNYICIPTLTPSNRDDYLQKIVSYILNSIGHSIDEIDMDLVKKNALKYSTGKIEYEKSLKFLHPELAKEMDNGMNDIKSDEITPGSALRIKFLCPNCQYGADGSWEIDLHNRVQDTTGCKQCGYNWHKAETNQPQNIKSQYRKSATPSKPKTFKYVELSDIDKEMQSWDF